MGLSEGGEEGAGGDERGRVEGLRLTNKGGMEPVDDCHLAPEHVADVVDGGSVGPALGHLREIVWMRRKGSKGRAGAGKVALASTQLSTIWFWLLKAS